MAFEKALIGEDGYFAKGVLGPTISATTGDATDITKGAWVQIVSKAATASIFGDLDVGQFYYAPDLNIAGHYIGAADLDSWQELTLTKFLDGVSWNVDIAGDEIETTTNALRFKRYRVGKLDASGTASFLYVSGITDKAGGLAQAFFDICEISATGGVTYNVADNDPIYLVGYLNEGKEKLNENQTVATVMQVELYNFTLPSKMSEAGNFDVPFRLVGQQDPVLYVITLPVV